MSTTHTTTARRRRGPGRARRNAIILGSASLLAVMTGYAAHADDMETPPDQVGNGASFGVTGNGSMGGSGGAASGGVGVGAQSSAEASASTGEGGRRPFPQGNGVIPGVANPDGNYGAQLSGGAHGVAVPKLPGTAMSDDLMKNNKDYPGNAGRRGNAMQGGGMQGGAGMDAGDMDVTAGGGGAGVGPAGMGGGSPMGGLGGLFGGGGGGGGFLQSIMSMFSSLFGGMGGGGGGGLGSLAGLFGGGGGGMGGGGGQAALTSMGSADMMDDGGDMSDEGDLPDVGGDGETGANDAFTFREDVAAASEKASAGAPSDDYLDVYPTQGGTPVEGPAGGGATSGRRQVAGGTASSGGVGATSGAAASGGMKDGTYTGPAVNHEFGPVQVKATVQGGRLTNVQTIQQPNSRSSRYNATQIPQLTQKAIAANSATIDGVSGSTLTSGAYKQSLQGALDQARG